MTCRNGHTGARHTSSGGGGEPRFFMEKSLHTQASLNPCYLGGGHARGGCLQSPPSATDPQNFWGKQKCSNGKCRGPPTRGGPVAPEARDHRAKGRQPSGSRGPNPPRASGSGCALSVPDGRHGFTFQPHAQRPRPMLRVRPAAAAAGTTATAPAPALSDRGASSHTPARPPPAGPSRWLAAPAGDAPPRARGRRGARRPGCPELPALGWHAGGHAGAEAILSPGNSVPPTPS